MINFFNGIAIPILFALLSVSFIACGGGGSGGSGNDDVSANSNKLTISNFSYNLENGQTYDDAFINISFDFNTLNDIDSITFTFFDSSMNQIDNVTVPVQGAGGIKAGYINAGFYLAPDFFDILTFRIVVNDVLGFHSEPLSGTFEVDGGFGTAYKYPFSNIYHIGGTTAIGDLNGDGLNDVAVIGSGGYKYFQIFYQNDQGLLNNSLEVSTSFYTRAITIGDVNNDGKPDIVLSGDTPKIYVYLQDPYTGQLSAPKEYTTSFSSTTKLKVVDVDLDGRNDVVVTGSANSLLGSVSIFYQDSNGELKSESCLSTYMYPFGNIVIADMDNDGDNDIVMLRDPFALGVIKQISKDNFSSAPELYSNGSPFIDSFDIGDVDGDGLNDMVYATYDLNGPYLNILTQNTQGTLDVGETRPTTYRARDINIYDITRDGLNDIICDLGNRIIVIPHLSDHTFGSYTEYFINDLAGGTSYNSLSIGDVTGDGRPDAVVSGGDEGLYVLPFYPHISKK